MATKILFYFRDVREGQGERNTFRVLLNWLGQHYPEVARKNLENVAYFGRYDDLYSLVGTLVEKEVFALFTTQLKSDIKNMKAGESVSLLAKWLKSENTSSKESVRLARKTREALELTPKRYRKILSALRKYIDVLQDVLWRLGQHRLRKGAFQGIAELPQGVRQARPRALRQVP